MEMRSLLRSRIGALLLIEAAPSGNANLNMSFYQGLPWASFSPTRDTSLGPPPGFGVTTTAALPAVSAPLSPTHDGHASWLPAAAPSAIDSVINRLVSNLSGFQPFIPLGSVPASPVTLVSDHSARASPAASTPEHHSERATSPITASPGDRRWSLTDDDDASNSIRTGQGSPSSIASSSWAKIAVTNVAPGPKALAHFRPLEDDIGVSVEEAIQVCRFAIRLLCLLTCRSLMIRSDTAKLKETTGPQNHDQSCIFQAYPRTLLRRTSKRCSRPSVFGARLWVSLKQSAGFPLLTYASQMHFVINRRVFGVSMI